MFSEALFTSSCTKGDVRMKSIACISTDLFFHVLYQISVLALVSTQLYQLHSVLLYVLIEPIYLPLLHHHKYSTTTVQRNFLRHDLN